MCDTTGDRRTPRVGLFVTCLVNAMRLRVVVEEIGGDDLEIVVGSIDTLLARGAGAGQRRRGGQCDGRADEHRSDQSLLQKSVR